MQWQVVLDAVLAATKPSIGSGTPAPGIPASMDGFGIAVATVDGYVHGAGNWQEPFSAQSITKVFAFALVLANDGQATWDRVGRRPSSRRYNALSELDAELGVPRNPFINAGALVAVDRLLELSEGEACQSVLDLIRTESANDSIDMDAVVAKDELTQSDRNAAIAHLIAAYGNMHHPINDVLTHYVWQCAIAASCRDLALAGLFLARGGLRADGGRLLSARDTRQLNAVMLTCGMYDASADVAHRVGLPAKSGVGGGILAIAPGRGTVCAWGPGLDQSGTSIAALTALDHFATMSGWSVF